MYAKNCCVSKEELFRRDTGGIQTFLAIADEPFGRGNPVFTEVTNRMDSYFYVGDRFSNSWQAQYFLRKTVIF
jgi:hypothetical protein